jgi:hypothetical protein
MIQRWFAAPPNNAREPDRLEVIGLVRESIRGGLRATLGGDEYGLQPYPNNDLIEYQIIVRIGLQSFLANG